MGEIEVYQGDITYFEGDAIVNAANEGMLGGGGVDGAIHRAAGPGLLEACRAFPTVRGDVRCPTGKARITAGFDLQARFVIHTVGPVYGESNGREKELLTACYRNSLFLAVCAGARSIAFPAISCGVYSYPIKEAAEVSVQAVHQILQAGAPIERVVLTAFDDETFLAWQNAVSEVQTGRGGSE